MLDTELESSSLYPVVVNRKEDDMENFYVVHVLLYRENVGEFSNFKGLATG
jgi:hypothetical protein